MCLAFQIQFTRAFAEVGEVFINEISAINVGEATDEDGDWPDWIEIANQSDSEVNLSGWSLTDNTSEPHKWVFPEVHLPASSFSGCFRKR